MSCRPQRVRVRVRWDSSFFRLPEVQPAPPLCPSRHLPRCRGTRRWAATPQPPSSPSPWRISASPSPSPSPRLRCGRRPGRPRHGRGRLLLHHVLDGPGVGGALPHGLRCPLTNPSDVLPSPVGGGGVATRVDPRALASSSSLAKAKPTTRFRERWRWCRRWGSVYDEQENLLEDKLINSIDAATRKKVLTIHITWKS